VRESAPFDALASGSLSSRRFPDLDRTPRESRPIRRLALLVLSAAVSATAARAADSAPPSSAESLLEMWAAPGLPGFVPDLHMHNGLPLTYMGLVAGAVTVRDGLLPSTGPWPGISEISAPRSWYDSVAVVVGEGGGWRGFSATLVELQGIVAPPVGKKPHAGLVLENGSSAVDRNGLMISRGGDQSWGRGGALDEERSGAGQQRDRVTAR